MINDSLSKFEKTTKAELDKLAQEEMRKMFETMNEGKNPFAKKDDDKDDKSKDKSDDKDDKSKDKSDDKDDKSDDKPKGNPFAKKK